MPQQRPYRQLVLIYIDSDDTSFSRIVINRNAMNEVVRSKATYTSHLSCFVLVTEIDRILAIRYTQTVAKSGVAGKCIHAASHPPPMTG